MGLRNKLVMCADCLQTLCSVCVRFSDVEDFNSSCYAMMPKCVVSIVVNTLSKMIEFEDDVGSCLDVLTWTLSS